MAIKEIVRLIESNEIALKAKDWGISAKGPVALLIAVGVVLWLGGLGR